MMRTKTSLKLAAVAVALATSGYSASTLADGKAFIEKGKANVNLRYRLETVDEDAKAEDAVASTLKGRLTLKSGAVNGFTVNAEIDTVLNIGADDYNDASGVDPKTQYPVVADPTGTDLNQLNVTYKKDNLMVVAGRQRIVLGNQRFVGGVAWRQNEQTYDGVRAKYQVNPNLSLDYSYVAQVNRIFGPDGPKAEAEGALQLFNANYKIDDKHKVTGFAYLLDYDNAADPLNTFGVDYVGKVEEVKLHATIAMQSKGDFDATYLAFDATKKLGQFNATAGFEQLGSDSGNFAFSTPLATAHKFQGFADKFLGTPNTGVNDYYVKVATTINGVKLAGTFHTFSAVEGDADYGTEVDLVASYKVHKSTVLVAKLANYMAEDHGSDTMKFWFMANTKF
jgi:hypothetical protein